MGEVAGPLGEDSEHGEMRLDPTAGVVGVEVLGDRDAAHRVVAVPHLGQPTGGVQTGEQR